MAYDLGNVAPTKPVDNTAYENPENPRQGGNTIFAAIPITGPGTYTGTTEGYTNDYDEVCPHESTAPDVVYSVLLGAPGVFDFDLCNSGYDTKLYIRDEYGNLIGCNDDFHYSGSGCYVYSSKLENVALAAGITYYVFIDGYGSANGPYQFDVTEYIPPEPLVCPPGAELEGEPPLVFDYVDNHNGGCTTSPTNPPFQLITQPDFCGVSGWYTTSDGNSRDTDWFTVEIPAGGVLTVTGESEYPMFMFELGPQNCNDVAVVQSVEINYGMPGTLTVNGTPGSIVWLWLGPTTFSGPVNEFYYILRIPHDDSVDFFGFTHTPIGDAHLTIQPDRLIVDNLGSSGEDGVSIDLAGRIGYGEMFDVTIELHDAVGRTLQTSGIKTVDGVDGQVVSCSVFNVVATDSATWHLDMSQTNPSSLTAIVMQNGSVVDVIPGLPTVIAAEFALEPARKDWTLTIDASVDDFVMGFPTSVNIKITFTEAAFLSPGGGDLFHLGPGEYFIDFLAVGSPHAVGYHTRMDLQGNMPALHITGEIIQPGPPGTVSVDEPFEIQVAPIGLISVSPNPFNPRAEIRFTAARPEHVLISVYDLRGFELRRLVDAALPAGEHRIVWDGNDLSGRHVSSGTYIVRMQTPTSNTTKRLTLIK